MQEQLKHEDITRKIIGCAMRVHTKLGNGFQEVIHQRSLEIGLALEGIGFEREKEMSVFYRDILVGTRRVDFFCRKSYNGRVKSIN